MEGQQCIKFQGLGVSEARYLLSRPYCNRPAQKSRHVHVKCERHLIIFPFSMLPGYYCKLTSVIEEYEASIAAYLV